MSSHTEGFCCHNIQPGCAPVASAQSHLVLKGGTVGIQLALHPLPAPLLVAQQRRHRVGLALAVGRGCGSCGGARRAGALHGASTAAAEQRLARAVRCCGRCCGRGEGPVGARGLVC